MPSESTPTLLADESFLNYCFERDEVAVRYWQEQLLISSPARQATIRQAKSLALLLATEAARVEADSQYQLLRARLVRPAGRATRPLWLRSRTVRRVAAWSVAALLPIAAVVGYHRYDLRQQVAADYADMQRHDIAPGSPNAILTLASGQRIDLAKARTGTLARQNGVAITKTAAGQLVYQLTAAASEPTAGETAFNTVETPVKGQFKLVLPDGTAVWLNAQSALSYPAAFTQQTRLVRLRGEAYFEVAHQAGTGPGGRRPFVVETVAAPGDARYQRIEVLGTHFNVNSYADEPLASTTLLEGAVRVAGSYVLRPGQQFSVGRTGAPHVAAANVEAAVAWKNGEFAFREDLPSALRKVARWYDVEIVYGPSAPTQLQLGGWISRQKNLSEVLHLLEATGEVHFKLVGRRVLVLK